MQTYQSLPAMTAPGARSSKIRRRFLAVAIPGLAVVLATTGYSFLGNTATVDPAVTAGGSAAGSIVYGVGNSGALPCGMTTLEYTTTGITTTGTCGSGGSTSMGTAVTGGWTAIAGSAGSVANAGDIAVIDATGASDGVNVSMYITNLANMQVDYTSLAIPVQIYECASNSAANCVTGTPTGSQVAWTDVAADDTYVTSTGGYVNWSLSPGYFYDITMGTGGSFYCNSTLNTAANYLSPTFYVAAQPY